MLPVRSKSLFELASVPPVHSESLFEPAVQDHYSKVLVSVALCSESLYSALLCYVHGYGSHFGMRNGRLTLLFTAREPLWRSKWPLRPARVLLERSDGPFGPASAPPERSKWPLRPAPVPPVRSKRLLKRASMLPVRSKWPFWPALVPSVRTKSLLEPASVH